jgi:hypothetical protein
MSSGKEQVRHRCNISTTGHAAGAAGSAGAPLLLADGVAAAASAASARELCRLLRPLPASALSFLLPGSFGCPSAPAALSVGCSAADAAAASAALSAARTAALADALSACLSAALAADLLGSAAAFAGRSAGSGPVLQCHCQHLGAMKWCAV